MIYCRIDLKAGTNWVLAISLGNAERDGIEVQAITDKVIIVTFRLAIWTQMAKGNLACVDIATNHMHRLYKASNLSVLAMFPGGFVLRMGAAKSFEFDKNPYKFNEIINTAIKRSVACAGVDLDPTLYI